MSAAGPSNHGSVQEDRDSSNNRIVVIVGQGGIQTDIDLDDLADDDVAGAIPDLLSDYGAECRDWTLFAREHWLKGRWSRVEDLIAKGLEFFAGGPGRPADFTALVNLHAMFAHFHLNLARTAPRIILPHAKYDRQEPSTKTKEYHYTEAAANLNRADSALQASGGATEDEPVSVSMGKISLYLARGQPNVAHPLVERLLVKQPNNLFALLAQARLLFAKRAHDAALHTYQKLLTLNPNMSPDPRIGLGLCAWILGDREKAYASWRRAVHREPSSWTALLLLGLGSLNTAREPSVSREERLRLEAEGIAYVQRAFKLNNKCAASALALATVSGQGTNLPLASKLAERAIQFSDNRRHTILANAERGRLGFMAGDVADAGPFIAAAKGEDAAGLNVMAELTLGQIAIKSGNLREALNFIEQTAKRLNGRGPLEYTVLHASLLAYPHPGMKEDELARNRATARNMLSELQNLVISASTDEDWARLRGIREDSVIFFVLARLWQDESLERAIKGYETAVSINKEAEVDGQPVHLRDVRISNNLGALFQLQGNVETAERTYQDSLSRLASENGKDAEVLKTVLAYNLARAYEEGGEVVKAAQWYRDVLRQHSEHMESKVRLAMLAAAAGRNFDAHTLLKESLKADEANITLRSVYSNFLISIGSNKEALAFTSQTLKFERSDVATYCALGWLHYTLGREAKSSQELAERTKQYLRSAEAYERALSLDPTCATAAQGLAIALAEDTLLLKQQGAVHNPADDAKARVRNSGQALSILSRINDSLSDGAVNVNMGHCYFVRGEEEKAIQSYEAALNTFKGRNASVLLYLARTWYAFATRESNSSAMSKALGYCQRAMHLQPSDRAILYNIAMIQQKSAEILLALEPAKRTLDELRMALKQAQQAANTFRALADDRSGALPYDADLADQRARYGDGLIRKAPEQLSRQEIFEGEAIARVEEARRIRAAEHERIQSAEAARKAEIIEKAAGLAEQRRKAREEALAWQEELNARQADEEAKKAAQVERRKKRKEGGEIESDDEGGERKVRRKKGVKKERKGEDEEEEARFSGADDGDVKEELDEKGARAAKVQDTLAILKGRKMRKSLKDPDEEDSTTANGKRGKQYKSKAYISDSDEDDDGESVPQQAEEEQADEKMELDGSPERPVIRTDAEEDQ